MKLHNQVAYSGSSFMFFIGILYFLLIIQVHYLGFYSSSLLGFLIPDSYSGSLSRFLEFLVFLVFLWLLISFLNQAGGLGSVLCSFCSSCKAVWKTVLPLCFPLCFPLCLPLSVLLGARLEAIHPQKCDLTEFFNFYS